MSSESSRSYSFNPDDVSTEPIPIIGHSAERQERIRLSPYIAAPLAMLAFSFTLGNSETFAHNISAATTHTETNDHVSEIVSEIADLPLRVDCNNETLDAHGTVKEGGLTYTLAGQVEPLHYLGSYVSLPVMTLRSDVCETLTGFDTTPPKAAPQSDEAVTYAMNATVYAGAVEVALHESEHVKQVFNEAEAECYAYQKLPQALESLGMNTDDAKNATIRALNNYSKHLMSQYYSEECRVGGAYDLGINSFFVQPESTNGSKMPKVPTNKTPE